MHRVARAGAQWQARAVLARAATAHHRVGQTTATAPTTTTATTTTNSSFACTLQRREHRVESAAAYRELMARSTGEGSGREAFWLEYAREKVAWTREPTVAVDVSQWPFARWFPDGETNLTLNALDRWVHGVPGWADRTAVAYESRVGGRSRDVSFGQLLAAVEQFAGALQELGLSQGQRAVIYMPMVPETVVAMLACNRLGIVHSVVFGGFAAHELAVRIDDACPAVLITASCGLERVGRPVPYAPIVAEAVQLAAHKPGHVILKQREEGPAVDAQGLARQLDSASHDSAVRLHDYEALMAVGLEGVDTSPVPLRGSDLLYTIYTSGTTGRPKGIVRDQSAIVTLQWCMEHFMGLKPGEVYWSGADVGWVVGHSFTVFGPLIHGCTTVLFEGKPVGTPDASVYWAAIEKHRVAAMFTAPTALRAIRAADPELELSRGHDLSSLRTLFVAGERGDPDTIEHFQTRLGVPLCDNWWQTETGWPICGMVLDDVGNKLGSCGLPLPGWEVRVMDPATGEPNTEPNVEGPIAIRLPLPPGSLATLYNNDRLYRDLYLGRFGDDELWYSTEDAGFVDEDGYVTVMGRIDDVINCAGHRLSTGALEEAIGRHRAVIECACFGVSDALRGEVPIALLVVDGASGVPHATIVEEVVQSVRDTIGPVAAFKTAGVVAALPKTRSGKILRRVMRKIADGQSFRVPATIEDEAVLDPVAEALRGLGYPPRPA